MNNSDILPSINSSAAYVGFVALCVIFALSLMNCGGGPVLHANSKRIPHALEQRKQILRYSNKDEPQPKWLVLKVLNFAVVISFIGSVLHFAVHANLNDSDTLLKFIAGWSVFVCYFIGFFGISFVDADELDRNQQDHDFNFSAKLDPTHPRNLACETNTLQSFVKREIIHHPEECTPLCTDRVSKNSTDNLKIQSDFDSLADLKSYHINDIANMVLSGKVKDHELEKLLDPYQAVEVRRMVFESKLESLGIEGALQKLPYLHSLDYGKVYGANCEVVVGYVPIPVGMVGPITLNNETVYFPMATTEGCLIASTNRGCKAISQGSGAFSCITRDGITRAPCVRLPTAMDAANLKIWCDQPENFARMKEAFESTTNFGKLKSAESTVAGRNVYIRLCCFSGDAMGMNMVSKGSLAVIEFLKSEFPNLTLVALSGNLCTDKKAAAINWIQGRGKSVVVEAIVPKAVVQSTLKTTVKSIVSVNNNKNLIGSAMAGTVGGFNAHAANIVTAIFIATGQDPAQNVESSNCITIMEETEDGDLWVSCTMPSIEVGTVGGGTSLPAQAACLKVIGCNGGGESPGGNARKLAHIVAAATMAGELSLLAALSANTLVQAHMQHNRRPVSKS